MHGPATRCAAAWEAGLKIIARPHWIGRQSGERRPLPRRIHRHLIVLLCQSQQGYTDLSGCGCRRHLAVPNGMQPHLESDQIRMTRFRRSPACELVLCALRDNFVFRQFIRPLDQRRPIPRSAAWLEKARWAEGPQR